MERESEEKISHDEMLRMTAQIVSAYVSHNSVSGREIPDLIQSVFTTLNGQRGSGAIAAQEQPKPAVPIRKSVTAEYIVCLEDGKKLKMLKRHLRSTYNMTPEEYRAKWGLAADYPMVAPNYAAQRSAFAKKIGLGRKRGSPSRRGRRAR